MNADFCMSTLPWDILERQKMQFWLTVFPSGCHRVLIFVRYDAYTMALRGLYDVVLPS